MNLVRFKITKLVDPAKQGSEVELGKELTGTLSNCKTKVSYTDRTNAHWFFYIHDTCEILEETPQLTMF